MTLTGYVDQFGRTDSIYLSKDEETGINVLLFVGILFLMIYIVLFFLLVINILITSYDKFKGPKNKQKVQSMSDGMKFIASSITTNYVVDKGTYSVCV